MQAEPTAIHANIDWSKWEPPKEGDVRSPCPCINALANHGILPRDGKAITKEMAVTALTTAINLDKNIASMFAAGGVASNPDKSTHSFNLDHVSKHNFIEHDCSLAHEDVAFGDAAKFDEATWKNGVLAVYAGKEMTDYESASRARHERFMTAKEKHKKEGKVFTFGIKENFLSYGETALYLNLLGKDGVAPVDWVRIFFEQERLPYNEGWRTPAEPISQAMMNKALFNLVTANKHKASEAREVGVGTVWQLTSMFTSFAKDPPCVVM
ncbi:Cloroperoxidase [Glonium stellatum]|uniref:Cloroperoxidase n=1 Tax=Glonium stellatum TaxID=574774 RepID=A0A8E2F8R7_9PEZI|nr:Cloroperoxidase [Glonium stellatum]